MWTLKPKSETPKIPKPKPETRVDTKTETQNQYDIQLDRHYDGMCGHRNGNLKPKTETETRLCGH